jgi:hypothetical protein
MFCNKASFYGEELAPRPTPKLEDHTLSDVRDCLFNIFAPTLYIGVGRDSSVGIATRYGLDGPAIESRRGGGGEIFHNHPPAPYTMITGSFPGVKRPVRGFDHPPHLAPKLKKEYSYTSTPLLGLRGVLQGELYLYLFIPR